METIPATPKMTKSVAKQELPESAARVVTVAGQKYEVRVVNRKRLMIPIGSPPTLHRKRVECDGIVSEGVNSPKRVPSRQVASTEGVVASVGEVPTNEASVNPVPTLSMQSVNSNPNLSTQTINPAPIPNTQALSEETLPTPVVSESVTDSNPSPILPSSIQPSQTTLQIHQRTESRRLRSLRLQPTGENKMKSQGVVTRSKKRHRIEGGEPTLKRVKVHKITSTSMCV